MTSAGCGLVAEDADTGAIKAIAGGDVFGDASLTHFSFKALPV